MKATELQSEIEKGNEHNYHISPFIIKTEMAKEIFMGFKLVGYDIIEL